MYKKENNKAIVTNIVELAVAVARKEDSIIIRDNTNLIKFVSLIHGVK